MSTVPEVLAALTTLATATLPFSQVINGPAESVTTTRGRLFLIADVEFEVDRQPDSLGGETATEQYVVPCSIVADVQTPEQSVADGLVWLDYEAMEAAIAAAPQLGLSATFSLHAAIVGNPTYRRVADSEGRHSLVRFGVDVFAAND